MSDDAARRGADLPGQLEPGRQGLERYLDVLGSGEELRGQAVAADQVQRDRVRAGRRDAPGRVRVDESGCDVQVGLDLVAADRDDPQPATGAAAEESGQRPGVFQEPADGAQADQDGPVERASGARLEVRLEVHVVRDDVEAGDLDRALGNVRGADRNLVEVPADDLV